MKNIIGLLAEAQSGKTTAANYLVEKYGFKKFSVGDSIKRVAKDLFNFTDQQLWGNLKDIPDPNYNTTPRSILQTLGLSGRNHLGEDVWIRGSLKNVIEEKDQMNYIVDDLRYLSDITTLRNPNVTTTIIKIIYKDKVTITNNTHVSESGVDFIPSTEIDYVLRHSKSPEASDLKNKLNSYMISLGIERTAVKK